jgi:two-component system heavy metal sensor histidine kinase CusS
LTVWYALSSFILVLLATGYLYWALARNLDHENDRFLAEQALPLINLLRERTTDPKTLRRQIELALPAPAVQPVQPDSAISPQPNPVVYLRVLDEHGQPIAATPIMGLEIPHTLFPEPQPFDRDTLHGQNHRAPDKRPFRLLAIYAGTDPSFIIQAAMDQSHSEALLAGYRRDLLLALGVALLACAAGGYQLARRGIRPVKDIAGAADRIGSSTLNERIAGAALPAELRSLADTFNDMLDRLESSFARLAQFAADIAHELRTPINNLRGEAEVALARARTPAEYQELLGSALEEYDRLSRLIDSLLFLARAEDPAHQIQRQPVDLGQELARLREFYEATAAEAGVGLTVACPENLIAQLDRTLLQRALGNLVSNSLRHTPAQGTITLSAAATDGCLRIEVADTGAGIAPAHLPRIFDRFYRAGDARNPGAETHVGLGLAIVKKIAELHGGSVAVASQVGAGTRITLSFPMTKL